MGHLVNRVADYLLRQNPVFHGSGYVLRHDVPLDSILRGGKALEGDALVDILVCRGDHVVLGVACGWNSEDIFRRNMMGMPYVSLLDMDDLLPFQEAEDIGDGDQMAYCLQMLDQEVTKILGGAQKRGSLMTHRRRMLEQEPANATGYMLPGISLGSLFPEDQGETTREQLIRARMLDREGLVTSYGSAMGLFLEGSAKSGEILRAELMTTPGRTDTLKQAMSEIITRDTKTCLAQRLDRLNRNLPSDDRCGVAALEQLLTAPLDGLYRNHPGALRRLRELLTREECRICPEVITYQDGLKLAHLLWKCFGADPWRDDAREKRMRDICGQLLLLLSEPFLVPLSTDTSEPSRKGNRSLAQRLGALRRELWKEYDIFRMPLSHYYRAASHRNGNGYSQWLYEREIRGLFEGDERPESAFNLMILVLHCHNLYKDETVEDWDETFPLLYNLLVDPIIGD